MNYFWFPILVIAIAAGIGYLFLLHRRAHFKKMDADSRLISEDEPYNYQ